MKTLDEVIDIFEKVVKHDYVWFDEKTALMTIETLTETLQYLREYKIKRERIMTQAQACDDTEKRLQEEIARYQEAVKNCELAENKYRKLYEETSQNFAVTSQNDPDGDHQQLLKCQALLQDFYRNDPLTWDELKSMEGKPVWIERNEKYCYPRWFIIERIYKWDSIDDSTMLVQPDDEELFLSEHGKTWQAYRKERG